MKKKVIATLLTVAMTASMLAGCGSEKGSTQDSGNAQNQPAEEESSAASADDADEAGEVTIKLFSNLPDRKNGQGLVEQTIIDEYMAANANVTIEVEALDEEAYKTKFKAYAMDGMPDVETAGRWHVSSQTSWYRLPGSTMRTLSATRLPQEISVRRRSSRQHRFL